MLVKLFLPLIFGLGCFVLGVCYAYYILDKSKDKKMTRIQRKDFRKY
jgi:Fe2+ transport system protein B